MSTPTTRAPWLRYLGGLACAAAMAMPAQAALVQGDWDPPYGAPFSDLGWRGSATIHVPTSCLAFSGTVLNDTESCDEATVVSAIVELYNVASPEVTAETLIFTGATAVDSFFVQDGEVTAFSLFSTSRVQSNSPLAMIPAFGTQALFELDISFTVVEEYPDVSVSTQARLPWYRFSGDSFEGGDSSIASVTVRTVAAPGSLGLAAAALLGAFALRRRG